MRELFADMHGKTELPVMALLGAVLMQDRAHREILPTTFPSPGAGREGRSANKTKTYYKHWINKPERNGAQPKTVDPKLAKRWYDERPELQELVQNVAKAPQDGHPFIERNQGESEVAYQQKIVQAIKDRYIYSGYYDAHPDEIMLQIRKKPALQNRIHQIIAALEGQEIWLQQEIHAQRREAYTPPAFMRRHTGKGGIHLLQTLQFKRYVFIWLP